MGIFGRLFQDPQRDLERAEKLLAGGEPFKALELAERAAASAAHRPGARELASRAREAIVASDLDRADRAEASEYWEDAAEWLRSALDHLEDGGRRAELEARLASAEERAREAAAGEPLDLRAFAGGALEVEAGELSPEEVYEALVGTLKDEVADLYDGRPEVFRRALVDFHDGRVESALAALDELLASEPDDPAALLERGRCRLASGDAGGARADFEAAWDRWGDEPLDHAGQTSVPGLWAEASLEAGAPEAVAERLEALAEPSRGRADLARPYALSLLAGERFADARDYLAAAVPRFGGDQDLPYFLAQALGRLGDRDGAVACLESAIAPSCAGGSCNKPPLHLPSVRALVVLHLDNGDGGLERSGELLTRLARATGGRLTAEDQLLLARFHELDGHPAAAAEARAEAARLRG